MNATEAEVDTKALEAALKAFAPDLFGGDPRAAHQKASPLSIEAAQRAAELSVRRVLTAYLSTLQMQSEAVAWMGYWPGAGSVNSETHTTHSEHRAKQWKDGGAEVTPLYASPPASQADLREALTLHRIRAIGSDRWTEWRMGPADLSPASGCEWEDATFVRRSPQ